MGNLCNKPRAPRLYGAISSKNIDEICDESKYHSWLQQTPVFSIIEDRNDFNDISARVNQYCWAVSIVCGSVIIVAHTIPILSVYTSDIQTWRTCSEYANPDMTSVSCIILWHIIDIPCVLPPLIICIITFYQWSLSFIEPFERLIGYIQLILFVFFAVEALGTWQSTIRQDPWYHLMLQFLLCSALLLVLLLGSYVQYALYQYLHKAKKDASRVQYPRTESEIVSLVKSAYSKHGKIRVIGSKHSTLNSIYVDDVKAANQTMISLDYYTGVKIIKSDNATRAVAKGGTCLGVNRNNPLSTESNGLVYILEEQGYSLPDLGGIVQQSVAGFTSMGCGGGTLYHDFYDAIYSVRVIDGRGDIKTFYKPTYDEDPNCNDPYWGVIVSMGLMGIISEITFDVKETYNVLGSQVCLSTEDWMDPQKVELKQQDGDDTGPLNIFSVDNSDPYSLYQLFASADNKHKTEFIRLFAWPQDEEEILVTVWKAHKEQPNDDQCMEWKENYAGHHNQFEPVYYHQLSHGRSGVLEQKILSSLFNTLSASVHKCTNQLSPFMVEVVNFLIQQFNETPGEQYFGADWARTLPMDQEIHTTLLPMQFTELYFDMKDTAKVMRVIKEYWKAEHNEGLKNTGLFTWEFYPGKACSEWLRPSFGRDSFRVDVLWFDIKTAIPYTFFHPFWKVLVENGIHFRPHWAKWFPGGHVECPVDRYANWSEYYAAQYPNWKQWHSLRSEMDPNDIFVTEYWKQTLDINMDQRDTRNIEMDEDRALLLP